MSFYHYFKARVDWVWNVMAHAQKQDFIFRRNGRVHLNRRWRQFSRLLAAEVWASAVVMLDTTCSEVVWRVLATHSIRQFPLHFPSRASPCAITFQLESTGVKRPGLEGDRPPSFNAKVKHQWICTTTAPYDFVTFPGTAISYRHLDFWSRR